MIAYWCGNFTLDYLKYLTFGLLAPLLIIALDVRVLIDDGNIEFFWGISLIMGLALISFAYAMSFYFKNASSA